MQLSYLKIDVPASKKNKFLRVASNGCEYAMAL